MSRSLLTRASAAVAVAASLAVGFALPGAVAPAHAADDATTKAAAWLAKDNPNPSGPAGGIIDYVMAYAAAGQDFYPQAKAAYASALTACGEPTKAGDYSYVSASGSAGGDAKCAVAAEIMGDTASATKFLDAMNGHDFTKGADNQFVLGLEATAFEKAGRPVPDSLDQAMLNLANDPTQFYNYDSAGTMLAGLEHIQKPSEKDKAATATLVKYLLDNQEKNGLWNNTSAVNTTGMVGPAMAESGDPAAVEAAKRAKAGVQSAQLGSGGLAQNPGETKENAMATTQGIFALAGVTMNDLTFSPAATPTPTPTPAPPTSATPTPAPSTSATPTPAPSTSAQGTAAVVTVKTQADCATAGGVWVVVANQGKTERAGCVKLTGGATALQALQALTPQVGTKATTYGPMLCTIDAIGDCSYTDKMYWSVNTATPATAAWTDSPTGAHEFSPAPGTAVGFNWGVYHTYPAQVTAADIPVPAPAAAPTATTSAPTAAPTDATPAPATPADPGNPGLADTGGSQLLVLILGVGALASGSVLTARRSRR